MTFSSGVFAGFDGSDVALGGSADASVVSVTPMDGIGHQYQIGVDVPFWFQGDITASIPAGAVTDVFGNQNETSTSTDNTVTVQAQVGRCFDENGDPVPCPIRCFDENGDPAPCPI